MCRVLQALNHVHSETLAQSLSEPARAQMRAAVLDDAPELLSLLPDLVSSLGEVRHRTAPLLAELRHSPELTTKEGLSYLDAKHMLLLMYCMHILFYILLKLEGQPVKSHPVMLRLIAAKTYLEKLKGIDRRVKHQVDKLLAAAKAARENGGAAGEGMMACPSACFLCSATLPIVT
jgi:U3 small nucleolar RNA-associated protein 3